MANDKTADDKGKKGPSPLRVVFEAHAAKQAEIAKVAETLAKLEAEASEIASQVFAIAPGQTTFAFNGEQWKIRRLKSGATRLAVPERDSKAVEV